MNEVKFNWQAIQNKLDKMTQEQLFELNKRVVAKIRENREAAAKIFAVGDLVEFKSAVGRTVVGRVTRRNKKSVSVDELNPPGEPSRIRKWRVAPDLLKARYTI